MLECRISMNMNPTSSSCDASDARPGAETRHSLAPAPHTEAHAHMPRSPAQSARQNRYTYALRHCSCPLRIHTPYMTSCETRSMRALAALSLRTRTHAPHSTPHASSVEPPVAPRPPTASEGALSSASDKSPVPFTVLSKVVPPFSHGLTKVGAREDSSAEIQRRNRG